tara:strand:+ start:207 stop:572 length:366 start_codon:yes stop_codon:yes gene_type:complete
MFLKLSHKSINLIHILIVSVLLILIGIYKEETNTIIYYLLGLVSLGILFLVPLPHTYSLSYHNLVYIFHYLFVLPFMALIVYFGVNKKITNNVFNIILIMGIFVFGYHSNMFLKNIFTINY